MDTDREYVFVTHSAKETQDWAEKLAGLLRPGDVIALEGDLGAGKTTFTQGFARGIGVTGIVNSPTFTIIKEYSGRIPLYHMDVYRVEDEWEELGLDEYFYGEGVTVVEWASMIGQAMPSSYLEINIKRLGEDDREIRLLPKGERYKRICEGLAG